jgi:hypothetical protein
MKQKINREWEERAIGVLTPHIKSFIDHSLHRGKILEIEFGSRYLSPCLESYHPENHLNIDPKMKTEWKASLSRLGTFDTVLCSDFSLETDPVSHRSAKASLENGKKLLTEVQKTFKDLSSIHYSDHDLDLFCKNMSISHPQELSHFLGELCQKGQISEKQKSTMTKKYNLEAQAKKSSAFQKTLHREPDLLLPLMEECLSHHMHRGSRFIGLCGDPTSKFENTAFFERIITNPNFGYQEKLISVEDLTMLGFVVEKLST